MLKQNTVLWKESLNSDDQQFHQYQQSEQTPLILTYWAWKKITTYDIENKRSPFLLNVKQTVQRPFQILSSGHHVIMAYVYLIPPLRIFQ